MGRIAEHGDHSRAQSINRVKETIHMAKKTLKWHEAPLANRWTAWGVIAAAGLALVLAVAKPSCKCGKPHDKKPAPAAR